MLTVRKTRRGWVVRNDSNVMGDITGRETLVSTEQLNTLDIDYQDNPYARGRYNNPYIRIIDRLYTNIIGGCVGRTLRKGHVVQ